MRRLVLIGAALAVAAGVAGWAALGSRESREEIALHAPFKVDEASPRIRALELKAVAGSPEAAAHLADMYAHCHKAGLTGERLQACYASERYWIDVAVENGSNVGLDYKVHNLILSGRCIDALRAEYLYARLLRSGQVDPITRALSQDIAQAKKGCSW
jgi:hypothetical protein